jgi:hypothetical protein
VYNGQQGDVIIAIVAAIDVACYVFLNAGFVAPGRGRLTVDLADCLFAQAPVGIQRPLFGVWPISF